jgi:hypothetical protein
MNGRLAKTIRRCDQGIGSLRDQLRVLKHDEARSAAQNPKPRRERRHQPMQVAPRAFPTSPHFVRRLKVAAYILSGKDRTHIGHASKVAPEASCWFDVANLPRHRLAQLASSYQS